MKRQNVAQRVLCALMVMTLILSLFSGMAIVAPTKAQAETEYPSSGDYGYEVQFDGTCSITGYSGSGGQLTIPSTLDGYKVTQIGEDAFYECSSLTNVTIPEDVTSIGWSAFYGCTNLKFNVYDNGKYLGNAKNPYHVLIEAVNKEITQCAIHKQTVVIGSAAFRECTKLTAITIPSNIQYMGDRAFAYCESLEKVEFLGQLDRIKEDTFAGCENLKDLCIPGSVSVIEDYAFINCDSLKEVNIPAGITEIGLWAFASCDSLHTAWFNGKAPVFQGEAFCTDYYSSPKPRSMTIFYPADDPSWTTEVMESAVEQDHYGNEGEFVRSRLTVEWKPYTPGTTVSGSLTGYEGKEVKVELWKKGANAPVYTAVITDGSYCFENVSKGSYVLKVTMADGVTRDYVLEAGSKPVDLDVQVNVRGDINGDKKINVGDTARVYAYIRGTGKLADAYTLSCADVNGDGKINVGDVARIYSHIKGNKSLW